MRVALLLGGDEEEAAEGKQNVVVGLRAELGFDERGVSGEKVFALLGIGEGVEKGAEAGGGVPGGDGGGVGEDVLVSGGPKVQGLGVRAE